MIDVLTEMLLGEYFTYLTVCGKLIRDKRELFNRLCDVFLIPSDGADEIYSLAQCEDVNDVKTYADYQQYRRIQKYSEMEEIENDLCEDIKYVISIKGMALERAVALEFKATDEMSETLVYKQLCECAYKGIIPALRILGLLQCEGMYVGKNKTAGLKNLEKAAQWNSEEGILTALYCNVRNRQENIDRLFTVASDTAYEKIVHTAESKYGVTARGFTEGGKLIKKAIGKGILRADVYSTQYARFIYSTVMGYKEKECALLSGSKEAIAATAELPLKLTYTPIECDPSVFKAFSDSRDNECRKLLQCAMNSDLRTTASYRPLCVSTDCDFISTAYINIFKQAFKGAHIEVINVADLSAYDLDPAKNNVFIRSCDERKNNVYFLLFKGDISQNIMDAVKGFLNVEKRRKFRLLNPSVTIDLSAILPVCFCDRENAKLLKTCCDVISAASVNSGEKSIIIQEALRAKAELYGLSEIKAEASAFKRLADYGVDRAENVIDRIVRFNRLKGGTLTITGELLKEDEEQTARSAYGFGGAVNESK